MKTGLNFPTVAFDDNSPSVTANDMTKEATGPLETSNYSKFSSGIQHYWGKLWGRCGQYKHNYKS